MSREMKLKSMDVAKEKQATMYLIYIDESYDDTHFAYSAIFVDAFHGIPVLIICSNG